VASKVGRLLYHWDNQLTLLDVGAKSITNAYSDRQCRRDLEGAEPAPSVLSRADAERASLFVDAEDRANPIFSPKEGLREWLYCLDDDQDRVACTLLDAALQTGRSKRASVHLVIGGPGTGKISVLAVLLDELRSETNLELRLIASEAIQSFLSAHVPFSLKPYIHKGGIVATDEFAFRSFIKFFGDAGNRTDRSLPVSDEVERAGCHWACTYPMGKRPRQVEDGSIMFMARLVRSPNDIVIFGRAIGL